MLEALRDYCSSSMAASRAAITRSYGKPAPASTRFNLELAQLNYMDEDSFAYDEEKAAQLAEGHPRIARSLYTAERAGAFVIPRRNSDRGLPGLPGCEH